MNPDSKRDLCSNTRPSRKPSHRESLALISFAVLRASIYLLNDPALENGSLLVLQIQGRPKEAISSAGTVGERRQREQSYTQDITVVKKKKKKCRPKS